MSGGGVMFRTVPFSPKVKRRAGKLAASAVGLGMLAETSREFFANDTIGYYRSDPDRLLTVLAIAAAAGAATFVHGRLSSSVRQRLRTIANGTAALAVTVITGWMAFGFASFAGLTSSYGWTAETRYAWLCMTIALVLGSVGAVALWHRFLRSMRTPATGSP